jgi:hypothetical protein
MRDCSRGASGVVQAVVIRRPAITAINRGSEFTGVSPNPG